MSLAAIVGLYHLRVAHLCEEMNGVRGYERWRAFGLRGGSRSKCSCGYWSRKPREHGGCYLEQCRNSWFRIGNKRRWWGMLISRLLNWALDSLPSRLSYRAVWSGVTV